MPRNYQRNGRPNGGKRPGAGRPAGSRNTLELGEVRALKAIGLRIPEGASKEERAYALATERRILDVMQGDVSPALAMAVLKAASTLREEQLGPVKQRVEHSFDAFTDEQLEARYRALVAKGTATSTVDLSGGAGTTAQAAEQKGADASLGPNGDGQE